MRGTALPPSIRRDADSKLVEPPAPPPVNPSIYVAIDRCRSVMVFKLQRKTCMSYFLYAVFFVLFCLMTQGIPESRTTHAAYLLAKDNAGYGMIRDIQVMDDANDWIAEAPQAIIKQLPNFCPGCKVLQHTNDHGQPLQVVEADSWLGRTPRQKWLPRNVSYDFDQTLRSIDSMLIMRGPYALFIEYGCAPLNSEEDAYEGQATRLCNCAEVYTPTADPKWIPVWKWIYVGFYSSRIVVLIFTFLDFLSDTWRERQEQRELWEKTSAIRLEQLDAKRNAAAAAAAMTGAKNNQPSSMSDFDGDGDFDLEDLEGVISFLYRTAVSNLTAGVILNICGIILPGSALIVLQNSPSDFKNLLGTNMYIICAQLFMYGRFWSPFTVIVETMFAARWQLYNFLITLITAFGIFAINGHIMFGTFDDGYATVNQAFVTVFDHLLNPMDASDVIQHNPTGGTSFFFVTNIAFILIMSQFLIAVLCGAFDDVRDEITADARDAAIPIGFVATSQANKFERSNNFFVNNFLSWNHKTCGMETEIIVEVLEKLKREAMSLKQGHKVLDTGVGSGLIGKEIVTGTRLWTELQLRGCDNIANFNRFLIKWGVRRAGSADRDVSVKATAQLYREEIMELLDKTQHKVHELMALEHS